jgi:hypothetical protein
MECLEKYMDMAFRIKVSWEVHRHNIPKEIALRYTCVELLVRVPRKIDTAFLGIH